MLGYEHGTTIFHRLDPRSKLVGQFGFAIAAFAHTETAALVVLTLLTGLVLVLARVSPVGVLKAYWFALVLLGLAPLFAMFQPASPWVVPERALSSVVAGYQIVLVLLVAAVYVRTTTGRETRGAIQRHVPGRVGQILGVGIALVFRFFPLVLRDVTQSQLAIRARAGDGLSTRAQIQHLTLTSLQRALARGETLSFALRARCLAWNPTLPRLRFSRLDYVVLVAGVVLALLGFT